jgi:hypothetical protein
MIFQVAICRESKEDKLNPGFLLASEVPRTHIVGNWVNRGYSRQLLLLSGFSVFPFSGLAFYLVLGNSSSSSAREKVEAKNFVS